MNGNAAPGIDQAINQMLAEAGPPPGADGKPLPVVIATAVGAFALLVAALVVSVLVCAFVARAVVEVAVWAWGVL